MRLMALVLSLLTLGSAPCSAQGATPAQPAPAFDVASVKKNTSGEDRALGSPGLTPNLWGEVIPSRGSVSITNAPLRELIARAYGIDAILDQFSLTGGPGNILSARFDIIAKPPD